MGTSEPVTLKYSVWECLPHGGIFRGPTWTWYFCVSCWDKIQILSYLILLLHILLFTSSHLAIYECIYIFFNIWIERNQDLFSLWYFFFVAFSIVDGLVPCNFFWEFGDFMGIYLLQLPKYYTCWVLYGLFWYF